MAEQIAGTGYVGLLDGSVSNSGIRVLLAILHILFGFLGITAGHLAMTGMAGLLATYLSIHLLTTILGVPESLGTGKNVSLRWVVLSFVGIAACAIGLAFQKVRKFILGAAAAYAMWVFLFTAILDGKYLSARYEIAIRFLCCLFGAIAQYLSPAWGCILSICTTCSFLFVFGADFAVGSLFSRRVLCVEKFYRSDLCEVDVPVGDRLGAGFGVLAVVFASLGTHYLLYRRSKLGFYSAGCYSFLNGPNGASRRRARAERIDPNMDEVRLEVADSFSGSSTAIRAHPRQCDAIVPEIGYAGDI